MPRALSANEFHQIQKPRRDQAPGSLSQKQHLAQAPAIRPSTLASVPVSTRLLVCYPYPVLQPSYHPNPDSTNVE